MREPRRPEGCRGFFVSVFVIVIVFVFVSVPVCRSEGRGKDGGGGEPFRDFGMSLFRYFDISSGYDAEFRSFGINLMVSVLRAVCT